MLSLKFIVGKVLLHQQKSNGKIFEDVFCLVQTALGLRPRPNAPRPFFIDDTDVFLVLYCLSCHKDVFGLRR